MTNSAIFWDRMAKRYSKAPISNQQAYEKKLALTRKYFTPNSEVFEFGCGTGSTAVLHSPFVKNIRAIDVSSKMLEIAKGKAKAENINNITFEQASIDDIKVADESYDVVLGLSILHLLPSKKSAMIKAFKMLKPGGVFVSSTFCARGMIKLLKPIFAIGSFLRIMPKVSFFSAELLQLNIKDAGFRLDHVWQPENSDIMFIVAKKEAR